MESTEHEAITFEFITDENFRRSLQSDHAELNACIDAQAWKAVLVTSGSIVEAVLADYLLSTGQKKPDPLTMDLASLIDACQDAGVLTQRTAELSSVIRSYRNLIHPGRVVRLGEQFGAEDAQVASHVVRIIVREVATRQVKEFGLTAEQLVTKFETDHNAPAITALLLSEMRPEEVRRLILTVLPDRYFEQSEFHDFDGSDDIRTRLAGLYREAFEASDDDLKKEATKRYVTVLREGSGSRVEDYGEAFFRGPDLKFVTKRDRELVIAHVLGRFAQRSTTTNALMRSAVGLSAFIPDEQLIEYFNGFIRVIAYDPLAREKIAADALIAEYQEHTTAAQDERLRRHLQRWIDFLNERDDRGPQAAAVQKVLVAVQIDDDIPF